MASSFSKQDTCWCLWCCWNESGLSVTHGSYLQTCIGNKQNRCLGSCNVILYQLLQQRYILMKDKIKITVGIHNLTRQKHSEGKNKKVSVILALVGYPCNYKSDAPTRWCCGEDTGIKVFNQTSELAQCCIFSIQKTVTHCNLDMRGKKKKDKILPGTRTTDPGRPSSHLAWEQCTIHSAILHIQRKKKDVLFFKC